MDEPRDCHTEWSKPEREGEISYDIPYMWNLKRNELTKQKQTPRLGERTYGGQGEGWGEQIVGELEVDMYTLLRLKWKTNKGLL